MPKLAVARSLGDFSLNPYVSAEPDIFGPFFWKDPERNYNLLILACDGLWDVTSEDEAVLIAGSAENPRDAAVRLRDDAYDKRSRDNISVLVVWFPGFVPELPKKESSSEGSGDSGEESESGSGSGSESESEEERGEKSPREKTPREKTPREKTPREKVKTPREKTPRDKTLREKSPQVKTPRQKTPRQKTPRNTPTETPHEIPDKKEKTPGEIVLLDITPPEITPLEETRENSGKMPRENLKYSYTNGRSLVSPPRYSSPTTVSKLSPLAAYSSPPRRTQSWSLTATPLKAHLENSGIPRNFGFIPKWKQAQIEKEQKERSRMEADKLKKLQEIRRIATRASQTGNPSSSAAALALSPHENSQ